MKSLVLIAMLVGLAGCPGRGRPTLEPEGTVTRTWVGEKAAAPPAEAEPPPPAAPAATPPVPDGTDAPTRSADDGPPSAAGAPARRGWVKGGSWER